MKRRIISMIAAAVTAISTFGAVPASAKSLTGFPHTYDFEDFDAGNLNFKTAVSNRMWSGAQTCDENATFPDNGGVFGRSLYIIEQPWNMYFQSMWHNSKRTYFNNDDTILYSYAVKPGGRLRPHSASFIYNRESAGKDGKDYYISLSKIEQDGNTQKFKVSTADWAVDADTSTWATPAGWSSLDVDKWYYINYKMDLKNHITDIVLLDENGNKIGETSEKGFRRQVNDNDKYTKSPRFHIQISGAGTSRDVKSVTSYDNFTAAIYNNTAAQVINSNGTDESLVNAADGVLNLRFDQSYDNTNNFNDSSKITITAADGTEFTDFTTVDSDFGGVNIQFTQPLKPVTEYKISFDKSLKTIFGQSVADYTFTTPMRQLPKVDFSIKDEYKNDVMASEDMLAVLETMTVDELKNSIDTDAQVLIYTDSSLSKEAAELNNNCVLVLTDGTGYDKYNIELRPKSGYILKNFDARLNGGKTDGQFANGTVSFNAELLCYRPDIKLDLVLASYDKYGKLNTVKINNASFTDDNADYINGTLSAQSVEKSVSSSDYTIKGFLFNSINTLTPICSSIKLTAAPEGEITSCEGVYPGYTNKAITLSFDDGRTQDIAFVESLNSIGAKCTFNLNSDMYIPADSSKNISKIYAGHEVANHIKSHPQFKYNGATSAKQVETLEEYVQLIKEGRAELEEKSGQNVRGMAWPNSLPTTIPSSENSWSKQVHDYILDPGNNMNIAYTRSDKNRFQNKGTNEDWANDFAVPKTWYDWVSTCHYTSINQVKGKFFDDSVQPANDDGLEKNLKLLSIWGHSWQFDKSSEAASYDMSNIINLLNTAKEKNVWNPTNIEYVDYINALRKATYDNATITNNSDIDLYFIVNSLPVTVKANSTYTFYEGTNAPTIFLAGDSTCEDESTIGANETRRGWGQYLKDNLSGGVKVSNHAMHSRSSKTYLNEGRFDGVVNTAGALTGDSYGCVKDGQSILDEAQPGDYVFIQFGHNDGSGVDKSTSGDGLGRGTYYNATTLNRNNYKYNLETMVTMAKDKGLNPVILTSISTPYVKESGSRTEGWTESYTERWREAARTEAAALDVPLLDVGQLHKAYLNTLSTDDAKALFSSYDGLHPTEDGAKKIAEIVANAIKSHPDLTALAYYVK